MDQFKKAQNTLKKATEKNNELHLQLKFSFWESISYERLGKNAKAEKIWKDLFKKSPFSYYGIISQLKLNQPFQPLFKEKGFDHELLKT